MRVADLAWAAGIIDGEGAVTMTRARPGVNGRVTLGFQVRISVRMTHEETIRRLHTIFGGTFKGARPRDPLLHRESWEWYAGDLLTVSVLKQVIPHLTTKRLQAELVLEFREKCFPRGLPCKDGVPAWLVKRRLEYFNKMTKLNKRGVA